MTAAQRVEHLVDLNRLADAEQEARTGLAAEPRSPDLLAALARVLLRTADHADGLSAALAAAAETPDDERVHRLTALHLSGLGRHAEAVAAAGAAVALAPNEPLTAITEARVLQRAGRHREALASARRAVELDPTSAQTHFLLADVADDAKDRRTARAAYAEVLRLDPQHAVARHDLAVLDARTRRPAAALAGLVEAGMLDPSLPVVLRSVVAVLWQLSWRLRMTLLLATVVVFAGVGSPTTARLTAAGVLLVVGLVVARMVRPLPPQARPVLWTALRTDRPLTFTYAALAVCVALHAAVFVSGFAPLAAGVWFTLMLLGVLAAVVRLTRWIGRRRSRAS